MFISVKTKLPSQTSPFSQASLSPNLILIWYAVTLGFRSIFSTLWRQKEVQKDVDRKQFNSQSHWGRQSSHICYPVNESLPGRKVLAFVWPPHVSLSPSPSPLCCKSVPHLNYCLAVRLLAAVPICATKRHEICITLISGPCQKYFTLASAGRVNYCSNLMSLVMQIKVTSECPDVHVSTDGGTFGKQGYHSDGNVLWFCYTKLIRQSAYFQMAGERGWDWNWNWNSLYQTLVYPLCLQPTKRRSLI